MSRSNHTNIPVGVLDTDSDLTQVSPEDFTYSLNTRQYPGEKSRRDIKGNQLVPYTQPAGTNETIGSVEDDYKRTLIDFVKNDAGNHHIRRLWEDGRYETLIEDSILNFSNRIDSSAVIDGKHLFWSDARGEDTISGNPPRYIDMDYISLYQKRLCYEVYWDQDSFPNGETYTIRIEEIDGTTVVPTTNIYVATTGDSDADAKWFFDDLIVRGFPLEAEFCGNKIKICATNVEQRIYITSSSNDIHFVGTNHYPETIVDEYISLIRMMPRVAPKPRFVADPAINENKVFGFVFQFRYRYLYWNGAKSKWSPISYVPTNFTNSGGGAGFPTINDERYNKIEIDFIDDIFASAGWKSFVRKVEIAVRYEFSGTWRSVGVYDVADFGVTSSVGFEFLNNGSYPVIPSDENAEGGAQALGNFDFVPRLTRSMEVIQDENGNHRLSLAGNLERFDSVDCVDAVIEGITANYTLAPSTPTDQSKTQTRFKRGGLYDFFIRYEDKYGRQWADVKIGSYKYRWLGLQYPRITLNHTPPIDAVRFRIAVSENQNQGAYLQIPSFDVNYWKADQEDGTFTLTTYAAGDADYVGFVIIFTDQDDSVNFTFSNESKAFLVQPGDRLHIGFTDEDYLIEGYNTTGFPTGSSVSENRYIVYIKFDPSQPNYNSLNPGNYHHVELYRPSNGTSKLNYEIGDPFAIIDAGLPTRSHPGPIDLNDLGDTYNSTFTPYERTVNMPIERPQLYGFKQEVGPDFGRASTTDPDFSEVDSYDQVRASDVFIPDSSINGLFSFRGLEYIRTRRDYGSIQSLQYVGGVLLAIGQFGAQPIYVGKARLMDLSGDTQVGRTSKLLNIGPELSSRLGTHNPESIVNTGRYVYGWDAYEGVPWRYSVGGGIDPISYKNINKFRDLAMATFPDRIDVVGGYEPRFATYYLSFKDPLFPETLGFSEKTPGNSRMGWEGNFSFIPTEYGVIGQRFFSFLNGLAYEHEIGTTLYGGTYVRDIKLVVNSAPRAVKIFWNVDLQGSKWWLPDIEVPPGVGVNAMKSRVISSKMTKVEGSWKANLPNDGNDPLINPSNNPVLFVTSMLRGRKLRGEVMELHFRLDEPNGVLRRVDTEFSFSEETKK